MDILISGRDPRFSYTANALTAAGHNVRITDGWDGEKHDCVLLPVGSGFLPDPPPEILFGGNLSAETVASARRAGVTVRDYMSDEAFVLENARLTALGALGILLSSCPVSPPGQKVAVIGFGRIGKFLSFFLSALGARVTVFSGSASGAALAGMMGLPCRPSASLGEANSLSGFRFTVNTAPAKLISPIAASGAGRGAFVLDLASGDDNLPTADLAAAGCGVRVAHGIPGKAFPEDAGAALAGAVLRAIG